MVSCLHALVAADMLGIRPKAWGEVMACLQDLAGKSEKKCCSLDFDSFTRLIVQICAVCNQQNCSFEQAEKGHCVWQFKDVWKIMWKICTFVQGLHPNESIYGASIVARQEKDGHVHYGLPVPSSLDWLQQCSQVTAFSQVFPDFEGLLHLRKTGSDEGSDWNWHEKFMEILAPNIYNSQPATVGILNGTKGAIVVTASLRGRLLPVLAWQQHGNTFVRHDPVFHQSA